MMQGGLYLYKQNRVSLSGQTVPATIKRIKFIFSLFCVAKRFSSSFYVSSRESIYERIDSILKKTVQ